MGRAKRYTRNLGRSPVEQVPQRGRGELFVRFEHAQEPYGVFCYTDEARVALPRADQDEMEQILVWFDDHLELPDSLVPVRPQPRRGRLVDGELSAVCWFRARAREHVEQARRLALLVRRARISIIERWTDRLPGQICSEDEAQLAIASFWH
jgi:hypothetical protein